MTLMARRSLASTQALLAAAFRQPSTLKDDVAVVSWADAVAGSTETSDKRLSPIEQLDVYREQFWLRHVDALRDDFASVAHCMGAPAFEALARRYLAAHPPSSFTLRDLGAHLADWLAVTNAEPFLVDLARVEWAFVEAFDASDAPRFDPAVVLGRADDDWPGARILLDPAVRRLALAYPAHECRNDVRQAEAASPQGVPRPEARPSWIVISRVGGTARPGTVDGPSLYCLEIERDAFLLLDELARGRPLGEACVTVLGMSETPEARFRAKLGEWFSAWTSRGILCDVRF